MDKEFYKITIGELMEIKKMSKMKMAEAIPKMIELKEKYNITDMQTKNLINLAKNFNTKMILSNKKN